MIETSGTRQQLLRNAHAFADSLDTLSLALLSEGQQRALDALSDLVTTYDTYAERSRTAENHLGFDETSFSADTELYQASVDDALVKVLTDLRLATALGRAGEAVEAGTADLAAGLADASTELNQAIADVEQSHNVLGGRLGFDESTGPIPSDLSPEATREAIRSLVNQLYDLLMLKTTELLAETLGSFGKDDQQKVQEGLQQSARALEKLNGDPIATRVLGTIQSAITTLAEILGPEAFKGLGERVDKTIEEIRKGGDALQSFLKYSFAYDAGLAEIDTLLAHDDLTPDKLATALRFLKLLQADIAQIFRTEQGIVTVVCVSARPIEWALGKIAGTLPFDLLRIAIFALVADIGLLHAMDVSDSCTVVKFVDGIRVTTRRALQA